LNHEVTAEAAHQVCRAESYPRTRRTWRR